jgi:hypothetical protein
MSGSFAFTPAQLEAAAKFYQQNGSAPSWWGSQIRSLGSGSAAPPSFQTQVGQQAVATASAADAAWLAGNRTPPATNSQGSWRVATNAQGQQVYVNTGTGEISQSNPANSGPSPSSTPSVGDVSQYLQSLVNAASTPRPSTADPAIQAAGSAGGAWLAGLGEFRLGSGSLGSYGVGSISAAPPPPVGSAYGSPSGSGRSTLYLGGDKSANTPTTKDKARNIRTSDDLNEITYSSSINDDPKSAGPIVTLLDLTNRDIQENDIFPLRTEITWFTRDQERRLLPFAPVVQETALRGPGAFGQRFTFDLGSIMVGDLLLGTTLQIRLDHWLDTQTQNVFAAGKLTYQNRADAWEYANSLGTAIIQLAELEVDGKTLETIDGDFIQVFSTLFPEYNSQVGIAYDHLGQVPMARLLNGTRAPNLFPIENGNLNCVLPFFFMRTRLSEAFPMISVREGNVKIHITLRPFSECVRQMRGFRDTCTSVPPPVPVTFTFTGCRWTYDSSVRRGDWDIPPPFTLSYTYEDRIYNWNYSEETGRASWNTIPPVTFTIDALYNWTASTQTWSPRPPPFNIAYKDPNPLNLPSLASKYYYWDGVPAAWRSGLGPPPDAGPPLFNLTYGNNIWRSIVGDWSVTAPPFKSVQLLTYGAIVDGSYRSKMLHDPFEILHRQVQTFYFDEPLKYTIGKRQDVIRIQLPLEANHPIEEILWFVRRKGTNSNNEWTNFTGLLESEWNARAATKPMLQRAILQANGTVLCDADEQFYREGIASAHRGGFAAYSRFVYGYSFAKKPGEHQPSGSLNASRLNSLRLTLDVMPPGGVLDASWEVKVFCIGMNWMRFENGLANPMFED